ncbi:MAG TPA: class I SAM-dependent methyltransferase [Steroidobacteraceae bacterium]|nr:class I SAM-dependent methyltransferase [Steroidobacteraceae bacterium]
MTHDNAITNVSDTALWVAALRAKEGKRSDAAFQDPLASMLAGERGESIARSFPHASLVSWGVAVRTSAIDRLLEESLSMGIDTVVNLGAGMDTRPYRMRLPPRTRWIEIDFPSLVKLKDSALAAHEPSCNVERIGLNLLDRSARNQLLAGIGSRARNTSRTQKTLLIAEGVLPYLSNEDVRILAEDLSAIPSFRYWILDFDNAGKRRLPKSWARRMRAAPFLFDVADWFKFFEERAWHPLKVITSAEESERLGRPYPFAFPLGLIMCSLPREMRRRILSASGAALLENHRR